jgi:hypothetical protein
MAVRLIPPMLAGSGHGPTGSPANFSAAVWFVAAGALTTSYCGR